MRALEPIWNEHFDELSKHLVPGVSEESFGLAINQNYPAATVHDDDGVWCDFHHSAKACLCNGGVMHEPRFHHLRRPFITVFRWHVSIAHSANSSAKSTPCEASFRSLRASGSNTRDRYVNSS